MRVYTKYLYTLVSLGGQDIKVLLDTGLELNLLSQEVIKSYSLVIESLLASLRYIGL